jgi:hypothetical protein
MINVREIAWRKILCQSFVVVFVFTHWFKKKAGLVMGAGNSY